MNIPTLDQFDFAEKKVLLRAGFDVPIEDGAVLDTSRIEAIVPTINHLLSAGAAVIIIAHQGRPKGERVPEMSQRPVVDVLENLLDAPVKFCDECRGDTTKNACESLAFGEVLLLENLRYEKAEKSKDTEERDVFGQELASFANFYVNDAFTNCHRDHASMTSVPRYISGCIGFCVQKEVEGLSKATDNPAAPVTLIVSGSKIETKVPVIENFLTNGDNIIVGGCIANTIIAASGQDVGSSRYDEEFVPLATELLARAATDDVASISVPTDVVVADGPDEEVRTCSTSEVGSSAIFDVGPESVASYEEILARSGTIVWNGPLGMYEKEQFADSCKKIASAITKATENGVVSIIGGGDTLDFHDRYNISMEGYTFVSTAGGAMMDFISGKALPALEALKS